MSDHPEFPRASMTNIKEKKMVNLSRYIKRTENYGVTKHRDGSTTHKCTLSFKGSVQNCIDSRGKDKWGIMEAQRFFYLAREAWLKGDLNIVADFFGVLV